VGWGGGLVVGGGALDSSSAHSKNEGRLSALFPNHRIYFFPLFSNLRQLKIKAKSKDDRTQCPRQTTIKNIFISQGCTHRYVLLGQAISKVAQISKGGAGRYVHTHTDGWRWIGFSGD